MQYYTEPLILVAFFAYCLAFFGLVLKFEVSVGGGAVTVKVNGKKEVLDVTMKPEVVDPDDIEMLQDLVISAVNEALRKVDDAQSSQMSKMTGGMNIPGLF